MATSFHLRLVRHGETDANVQRIIESHTPTPLNDAGRRQAAALGAAWRTEGAAFRLVLSSDTTRALETCRRTMGAASDGADAAPAPRPEPLLRERNIGALSGLPYEEANRRHEEARRAGEAIADVETPAEAQQRAAEFFKRLVEEMSAGGDGSGGEGRREVAVFSHAGLLHFLLRHLQQQHGLQLPPELLPAGQLHFSWNTGQTRLLVQRDEAGAVAVRCEFLHRDDHLTGDLMPTIYLLPNLGKVPRGGTGTHSEAGEQSGGAGKL